MKLKRITIGLDTRGLPCTPTEGYMVGIPGSYAKRTRSDPNFHDLMAQFEDISHFAEKYAHKLYAGGWFDGENGTWYLDISECVPTLEKALKLARERGELAVWDVAKAVEFWVPEETK